MKNLDRTKAYDLRDLNDEQINEVLNYLKNNIDSWKNNTRLVADYLIHMDNNWWQAGYLDVENKSLTNALELFELQIGDTFEYNGYICEVKEPIKRWVYSKNVKAYFKTREYHSELVEITNQQLIKLLEENEIH